LSEQLTEITSDLIQRSINVQYPFGTNLIALKGDGSDETVNIKAFFTYAKTVGQADIYFPKGTYCISNYIQVYKNTTVILNPNAVIKRIGSYYKMFANGTIGNATYASGGYNGDGNIHFIGGTFDLNCQVGSTSPLPASQTVTFFDLGHAENVTFKDITVKNGQIGHYFQVSSMKNVRFKDCWFGDVVYSDTSSALYELIQIEEATASSFPSFGGYDLTPSRDIFIEGCTFSNVIRAIGTHSIGYNVFAENIQIRNCVINNAADNAISLWQYKNVVVENTFINGCQYSINMNKLQDSVLKGNVILNTQKSGLYLDTCTGNKFSKNIMKEIALSTSTSYAAIRLVASTDNSFDDDTVTAVTPNYTYAWFSSDGSTGNRIISHRYTTGKSARIGGSDDIEMANYQIGAGQEVLFDGDLSVAAAIGTLLHNIRNFNFLVIMGNNNSSATAQLASYILPKSAIIVGSSTSRYRMVTTDSATSNIIEFSFPTGTSIQVDAISGVGHIRKVVGIY
jgi:hypothetical protein